MRRRGDALKYQLWYSESERLGKFVREEDVPTPNPPDARIIWAVEANSYDEACQKRDEFLERAGFSFAPYSDPYAVQELKELLATGEDTPGRHKAERSDASEQTTQVTAVAYVDNSGNDRSFEVPGWIGITAPLGTYVDEIASHLADAGATSASLTSLKQVYIERPYRDLSVAPEMITAVTLRRADESGMCMLQEFVGRIEDLNLLSSLVSLRLGASIAGWRFVEYHVFKRGGR
jgi:hypothetical protein